MNLFVGQSRQQLRAMYVESWRKSCAGQPLTAMEDMVVEVIQRHAEYQPLLQDSQRTQSYELTDGAVAENPFLHMGLHLAVREQVSVDRPAGIRAQFQRLQRGVGGHEAEHALMQVLGELLWDAQRLGRAPDEADYLRRALRIK